MPFYFTFTFYNWIGICFINVIYLHFVLYLFLNTIFIYLIIVILRAPGKTAFLCEWVTLVNDQK